MPDKKKPPQPRTANKTADEGAAARGDKFARMGGPDGVAAGGKSGGFGQFGPDVGEIGAQFLARDRASGSTFDSNRVSGSGLPTVAAVAPLTDLCPLDADGVGQLSGRQAASVVEVFAQGHGSNSIAFATACAIAKAQPETDTVRCLMKNIDDYYRERLQALADKFGGNALLGRALGYADGAFVGQMLRGDRPITEKTRRKAESLHGCAGWFDSGKPAALAYSEKLCSADEAASPGTYTSKTMAPIAANNQDEEGHELPMRVKYTPVNLVDLSLLLGGFLEAMSKKQRKDVNLVLRKILKHPHERYKWAPLLGALLDDEAAPSGHPLVDRIMRQAGTRYERQTAHQVRPETETTT